MREAKEMQSKKKKIGIIIGIIVLIAIATGAWMWDNKTKTANTNPQTDIAQVADGPRQKPTQEFLDIDSKKTAEGIDIRVSAPHVNATITSPLTISGEAKGWYKDNAFPVQLVDEKGNVLGTGIAKSKGDGTVDTYVPFEAKIEFDKKDAKGGDLIFQKADNIGNFSFPIFF